MKMTAMPQMVAIFNGVGGGAAALVSVTEFISLGHGSIAVYKICEVLFGVLVGSVSFAGSAVAFAKLQELMTGRPLTYPAQQPINAAIGLTIVVLIVVTIVTANTAVLIVVLFLSVVLGGIFVLPIGSHDMALAVFHQHDFLACFLADVFRLRTAKPHGQRPACGIVINFYFGHIFSPSLMASVGYAVMRKPFSPSCLLTAQTQRRLRRLR